MANDDNFEVVDIRELPDNYLDDIAGGALMHPAC